MAATTGIRKRHSRRCASRPKNGGGKCNCSPAYEAHVWSARHKCKLTKTFPTFAAAKGWRTDAEAAKKRGRLQPQTRKTIVQAADELLAGMRDGSIRSSRRKPYKPSTIRSYEQALGTLPEQRVRAPERLLAAFGEYRLTELHKDAVQDYCERLLSAGFEPATLHNQLDPLRCIYRRARQRDEVGIDPLEGLELPSREGKPKRIAQPAEAASLLEALPDEVRPVWATAFYAGLRRGELRALRVHDLDFAAGVIRVRRTWDDMEGEQQGGKSDKAVRDVPIVGALREGLLDHLMRTVPRPPDLVFGDNGVPFCPTTVRRHAREAWAEAGLEPITMHSARHTFASVMIAAGVDAKAIQTYMGHSSIKVTYDTYGHLFESAAAEATRRVDAFLAAAQ